MMKAKSSIFFCCAAAMLLAAVFPLPAQVSFALKSAPADLTVSLNGTDLKPVSTSGTLRNFRFEGSGTVRFSAPGYQSLEYQSAALPIVKGLAEIKLENERGIARRIAEYPTGTQPKSAYFSPDGKRLFVPLLEERGIDVFRVTAAQTLEYDRRLSLPGGSEVGFVEALMDARRREIWFSNMHEGKVHIFDLDTLAHKTSLSVGGRWWYPKVIVQNPAGNLTITSNWEGHNLSVFDSDTKELLHKIPVGGIPRGMAFTPDGKLLYTTIYDTPTIAVVDMEQNKVVSTYRYRDSSAGAARHVIYKDGKLYVSDMYWGTVNILDAATGKVLLSKYVGQKINTIIMSPDGKRIIASSRGTNNPVDYVKPGPDLGAVYIMSAEDLSLQERIWGRNQPTGLGISPDGKLLVFTDFLDANLELYRLP